MQLDAVRLDEKRTLQLNGSDATHTLSNENLMPMERWLLQDITQEPVSNIIYVKAAISQNEIANP